jgi:hypothetical protein
MTPELVLDSPYDVKRIRFRTGSPATGDRGVFTLRQRRTEDTESEWDFDRPFQGRAA